ncbi:DEAD/DEAH box helicase [Psychrobium sp. 1_MG-2023]|uniref:DEAD/DEAH box helicase n=1 Tax=Psychrobium sp. 1_MG-2023 TaxID=3062624 RepID=UPI000C338CA2|nr:DEAD/DEAH box helicase [Psychrobium sp. 1_MG-2023]MDP2560195.1 DEAD/DEAH box helicase [Psychrobium sp. 1_MG-2023]PKF57006.1 ATP-dependent helicase [Alteromonadales bacterium alter-6D02]
MKFQLRSYQQQAVQATIKHFRQTDESAVIVLPTGSGKSLVIAELARLARHKILVLAHVKELVEQNHAKYQSYELTAGIFSAGLKQKNLNHQVTFGSVQSVAPNLEQFNDFFSLVIIDECHRIGLSNNEQDQQNQYQQIITHLTKTNPKLKVLGLTATPYRMGLGWIYQDHYHGFSRNEQAVFKQCIYEMPLSLMIKQGYLTKPSLVDAAIAHYDFSSLCAQPSGELAEREVNTLLTKYPRVTQAIVEQIVQLAGGRQGVMIFAATTKHAQEIIDYLAQYLPDKPHSFGLILGTTPHEQRDDLIKRFKRKELKFLVNVAVLTTGFDAPHVDFIALLRPTQSVSLFQQIVGRGLRLAPDKNDCLIIDYANSGFNIFSPEVGSSKPNSDSVPVLVNCPICQFGNTFWGKVDDDGAIIEHYGRRCWGIEYGEHGEKQRCDYRFRFKECGHCGAENDIAARVCTQCDQAIIDPDQLLKNALKLKDSMVIRCSGMEWRQDTKSTTKLKVIYYDEDGASLSESFDFQYNGAIRAFNQQFGRRLGQATTPMSFETVEQVLNVTNVLIAPDFVIAKKQKHYWQIKEKIFDYHGQYRKANEL